MKILYFILFFITFSICSAQLIPSYNGSMVTGYSGSGDTLVIPHEYHDPIAFVNYPVTRLANSFASQARDDGNLKHLVIPGTITTWYSVNTNSSATGLQSSSIKTLTIGEGLTSIPDNIFYRMRLKTVNLPESFQVIGNGSFKSCNSLENINLPNSLMSIGQEAFYGCHSLRINNLPTSIKNIGYDAFYLSGRDSNLDSNGLPRDYEVNFPEGILVVPENSFRGSSFTKINLHENVREIQGGAFQSMPYLTQITIPASVNYLGYDIFSNCSRLTSVTFEGNLPSYSLRTFSVGDTYTAIPTIYYKNFPNTWELHNQAIGLPLVYLGPPIITLNPQDMTANQGSEAIVSVTASDILGSTLNYQWLKNGVDLDGETASSINFNALSASDIGNYQVRVSNGNGSVLSESASIVITPNFTAYSQEQYDAAFVTAFTLGVQSVSGTEGNPSSGYTLEEISDLRPGSTMIEIEDGQATISMDVEQSDDLEIWTIGGAASVQMNVQPGEDKKFFRFKMSE